MRKRVWFCLALAILFVCLIGVIAGCNPDDTDKNTTAPLAGKFVNDSYYWLDSDTYVITRSNIFPTELLKCESRVILYPRANRTTLR